MKTALEILLSKAKEVNDFTSDLIKDRPELKKAIIDAMEEYRSQPTPTTEHEQVLFEELKKEFGAPYKAVLDYLGSGSVEKAILSAMNRVAKENISPSISHVTSTKPLNPEMIALVNKMAAKAEGELYDDLIQKFIGSMDELSKESIKYFLQTGTINGGFKWALGRMLKFHDELCHEAYSAKGDGWIEVDNGVTLIAKERHEQIEKHGRSVKKDVLQNSQPTGPFKILPLLIGATKCIGTVGGLPWPDDWDKSICNRIDNNSRKEKLIIAGALIAAEIDRIIFTETLPAAPTKKEGI